MSLTEEKIDAIIKDYNEHMTVRDILKKHSIGIKTWTKLKNSLRLHRERKTNDVENDKVIKKYAEKNNIQISENE